MGSGRKNEGGCVILRPRFDTPDDEFDDEYEDDGTYQILDDELDARCFDFEKERAIVRISAILSQDNTFFVICMRTAMEIHLAKEKAEELEKQGEKLKVN